MKRITILILISNLICFASFGQIKDIVQTDGIKNQILKDNIGKVTFMNGNITLNKNV